MRKTQLMELLELAKMAGNQEMVNKLNELLSTETLSWEKAVELAQKGKLTVKRGCYTRAAELLVELAPAEKRDEVLTILSVKLTSDKDE